MTMKKTEFTFPSASKEPVDIHAFCYQDERREPVGIVQITHGLSEHMEGFEDLISFLTENGCIFIKTPCTNPLESGRSGISSLRTSSCSSTKSTRC